MTPSVQILGFTITEPATLLTDYLMAILCVFYSVILAVRGKKTLHRRFWSLSFGGLALAALLGGSHHGFNFLADSTTLELLWRGTLAAAILANGAFFAAAAAEFLDGKARSSALVLACGKTVMLLVLSQIWLKFILVLADGVLALAFLAFLAHENRMRGSGQAFYLLGCFLMVVGAFVQASGLAPSPWFNHNDLFHIAQMAANHAFFRGVLASEQALDKA